MKSTGPGWELLSGNCSLSATRTSVSLALLSISLVSVSDSSQGCGFSFLRPSYECCRDVEQRSGLPWLQTASLCSGPKALECTGVGTLISAACSVQEDLTPTFSERFHHTGPSRDSYPGFRADLGQASLLMRGRSLTEPSLQSAFLGPDYIIYGNKALPLLLLIV